MADREIYRGSWWLPSKPDNRVPGTLIIDSDGSLTLELIGAFDAFVAVPAEDNPDAEELRAVGSYDLIFGIAGAEHFTLIDGLTRSGGKAFGEAQHHIIEPQRAIRGERFLQSDDENAVEAIYLRVDYLTHFSALSGFEHKYGSTAVGAVSSTASYRQQEEWVAQAPNMTVRVGLESSDFQPVLNNPDSESLTATQRGFMLATFETPVTVAQANETAKRLQDLVTLAMNRPCASRDLRYQFPTREPTTPWEISLASHRSKLNMYAYGRQIYQSDGSSYKDPRLDSLFSLQDLPFEAAVSEWFSLYEKCTTGIQILLGTKYLNVGYVSSRLMNVAAALESIHTGLYDRPLLSEGEWKTFITQALTGVKDAEHRKIIHTQVFNRMTYRERALELARKLPFDVSAQLLIDVDFWAKSITKSRNSVAHALDRKSAPDVPGFDLFLMLTTQTLLLLVLARELGLSDEQLRAFVQGQWSLTTRFEEIMAEQKAAVGRTNS